MIKVFDDQRHVKIRRGCQFSYAGLVHRVPLKLMISHSVGPLVHRLVRLSVADCKNEPNLQNKSITALFTEPSVYTAFSDTSVLQVQNS